jgi:hypothetical protein
MKVMPNRRARALALTLLLGAGITGPSVAQTAGDAGKEAIRKQDPVPPAVDPKPSEQAGTTEPSAKVQGTNPDPNAVFVKGVLAVPGANTDGDTAPAKHWARTNQDDQIPIAGYRLKQLEAQQLKLIAQELSAQRDAPTAAASGGNYAVIGAEIPADTARQALSQVPDALADKFSALRGAAFVRAGGKIVIVDPKNNIVIGVLGG